MQQGRDLLICNNSLWAASLLKDSSSVVELCPNCGKGGLEIILVYHYESYKISIDNKNGIGDRVCKGKVMRRRNSPPKLILTPKSEEQLP